jgi:hypothetical protein
MPQDYTHTLNELEELLYDLTVSLLGEEEDSVNVRRSWFTEGAPAFGIDDNITFFKVYDIESPMTRQRDSAYSQEGSPEAPNMATGYTRTLQTNWTFYGPNSWANAMLVRNGLFYPDVRDTLARERIYAIPDMRPPQRAPELFSGQWYERVDLEVRFNEAVVVNRTVPYIESVRIVVEDYSGEVASIDVEE